MSEIWETKAGFAADLYPWPRHLAATPVCVDHDPELWFPNDKDDYTEAVTLCGTCDLREMCADIARTRGEYGVWGGVLFKAGRPLEEFPQPGRPRTSPVAAGELVAAGSAA